MTFNLPRQRPTDDDYYQLLRQYDGLRLVIQEIQHWADWMPRNRTFNSGGMKVGMTPTPNEACQEIVWICKEAERLAELRIIEKENDQLDNYVFLLR